MPAAMSKRERVDKTLAGQETDRVPLYDLLRNDAAFVHFGGEALPPLANDPETLARLNRLAGRAVNAFLDMTRAVGFGPAVECETTDEFGFVHHHAPSRRPADSRRPFDDEVGRPAFAAVDPPHAGAGPPITTNPGPTASGTITPFSRPRP